MRDLDSLVLCSAPLLPDPTRPDRESLALQARAASAAGFRGISLWSLHEAAARSGGASAEAVREQVLGLGLEVPLVEAILPWDAPDEASAVAGADPVLALAQQYGAQYVLAVTLSQARPTPADGAARLRAICARAADRGLQVAVEFLPWTGIPDLATAWRLVESAECDNGGILLDAWHWQRQPGGPCPDLLRGIPGQRISIFQLCDAAAEPRGDALEECTTQRPLPGEGVVDLTGLLAVLEEIGADPLIAPEIFNRDLAAEGPDEMARRIWSASRRVLLGRTSESA